MFKRLLNGQIKTITSAAVIIGTASLVSRLLGVFRDRILAGEFGAGDVLDIYYAAFRIPDLVFNLLVLGALSAGFIPVFTAALRGESESTVSKSQAWRLANGILNILGISLIVICGLLIFLAPWIVPLITPGFNPEKTQLTIALTRIMFLSPIFLGLASVFGGILQTFRRFFVYSLAPIMYNIGIILGALFLVPVWGIYGLAWGVVLGAFMHLVIQLPIAINAGFKYQWVFNLYDKGIRQIIHLMVPRTLALAIGQINLIVITIIASTLTSGSLTIFNLANNLQHFPVGIFGISFAIAAFPALSDWVAKKNLNEFVRSFSLTLRQIMFFIIPATVLFLILKAQIVRVVLGTGAFDWEDTVLTINTLELFTLSLFAQALIPLLARSFYALHNTKIPFFVGLVSMGLNVILSLLLALAWGVSGLALAFSISSIINLILLWLFLRVKVGGLDEGNIVVSVFKISVASLGMGAVVQSLKFVVEPLTGTETFLGIFIQGAVAGLVGIAVYIILVLLLRSPEMVVFYNSFRRRFLKTAPTPEEIDSR